MFFHFFMTSLIRGAPRIFVKGADFFFVIYSGQ